MLGETPQREVHGYALRARSRPSRRLRDRLLAGAACLFLAIPVPSACAQGAAVRGEVSGAVLDGFARLVFTMREETPADVRLASGVLIVSFKRAVNVSIDHLPVAASGYVSAVRRDPDGTAVRLALSRKVKVNTMRAGERLFVDLLPEGWAGSPPPLPQDVVEELARRAIEAEGKLRKQEEFARRRRVANVRVRAATLPTLTRYLFEVPESVSVTSKREGEKLKLAFQAPIRFDLADVKAALPPLVSGIEAEGKEQATLVRFSLGREAEVRTFRDGGAFVLDVSGPKQAAVPAPAAVQASASGPDPATEAAIPQNRTKLASAGAGVGASEASASEPRNQAPPPAPASASREGAPQQPAPASPRSSEAGTRAPAPPVSAGFDPALPGVPTLKRQGDTLHLSFTFPEATPAAVFQRADTLWLVFDSSEPLDVSRLRDDASKTVRDASLVKIPTGQAIRLKLGRPVLAGVVPEGRTWLVMLNDAGARATPLAIARTRTQAGQPSATLALPNAGKLHRLPDRELGDTLLVVTAGAPARSLPRTQDFVDFRALATAQGFALLPLAEDLSVTVSDNKVSIERPDGLIITAMAPTPTAPIAPVDPALFGNQATAIDPQTWGYDRQADPREREPDLMAKAAGAPESRRTAARFDLARFYLASGKNVEAKGALDVALATERDNDLVAVGTLLRGVAYLMLGRDDQALRDFSDPALGKQHDAGLWRAVALARMGHFPQARDGLKQLDTVAPGLPLELQRVALLEGVRTSLECGELAEAARRIKELDGIGAGPESGPPLTLLSGRLAEALGRTDDAASAYHGAAESADQPTAVQARLRELVLDHAQKRVSREDAIGALERLAASWRGDETELETLQRLARFYTEDGRFREAFQLMRIALSASPRSETTRRIQDEAGATFEDVFLGDRGNGLTPVEALGLFYDFRSLTPPGRQGDEMIRRLAERLVSMDLLGQAAELLQHQVDRRLQGIARAQVAARLATVYLMDRKPARALKTLHDTRAAELPNELRSQRLLLEARALSETGRHALALEITEGMAGREAERLRADVLWSASRWQEAAEQIERMYGERWRDFAPLETGERADVLRGAVGYALASDAIGADRFRQRYAAKMADGPERRMFDVVSAPLTARGEEFRAIAKAASTFDTLSAFLADMNARFPGAGRAARSAGAAGRPG